MVLGSTLRLQDALGSACNLQEGADGLGCCEQIWATGDVSHADTIFAQGVQLNNVVYGGAKQGVDAFKSMVTGIFKASTATSTFCLCLSLCQPHLLGTQNAAC